MTAAKAAGPPTEIVRFVLSPAQVAFWQAPERHVCFEGAVRSGKTSVAILRVIHYCQQYPGMTWLLARWTQDATEAQLKPRFRELCSSRALMPWNGPEQFYEIKTEGKPSRVYIRGLKSSEDIARYSKFAGLTLAGIYIDQPEEIPEDFWAALKARLSQPDYPQQIWLTPNPPAEGHWLCREFPDHGDPRPGYRYIRTTVYDNRTALGEEYIRELEDAYPAGSVLRRRFIDGQRGLSAIGDPVYRGYFQRRLHETEPLEANQEACLYESWDFGHLHPCVVWGQFLPNGALHLLGGIMGEAMFIEDFAPIALQTRAAWFPGVGEVRSTGDPAGVMRNSQGTNRSAGDILQANGIRLEVLPGANHPDKRNTAIQAVAGYMRRLTATGAAFRVHPRFLVISRHGQRVAPVLVDGLEAGYVWDERSTASTSNPSTRRPKKDGYYDHAMNCLEYLVLQFGPRMPEARVAREEGPRYVDPVTQRNAWMS